MLNSNYFA